MFSSTVIPAPMAAGVASREIPSNMSVVGSSATIVQSSPPPNGPSPAPISPSIIPLLKRTITTNSPSDIKALTTEIEKKFKQPCASPSSLSYILMDFLELLLLCKSGEYTVHPTNVEEVRGENEAQCALHAAVASIACSAASSIAQLLKDRLAATSDAHTNCVSHLFFSDHPSLSSVSPSSTVLVPIHENGGSIVSRSRVPSDHFLLLAAQCLFLLSHHFNMTGPWVSDMLDVIVELLLRIQKGWRGVIAIPTFVQGNGTSAAITAFTWLLIFAVGNATASWQRKRMPSGKMLGENSLVYETHNSASLRTSFTRAFVKLSKQLNEIGICERETKGSSSSMATTPNTVTASRESFPTTLVPVVDGFISILYLHFGCLLCALKDESGYDYALEAFVGGSTDKFPGFKGKVAKRMVQLAPHTPSLLCIPVEKIFLAPYEVLSYLMDDMLPLLHHLSELEQNSLQAYLDQLLRLEEPNEYPSLPPLMESEHADLSSALPYHGSSAGVWRNQPSFQAVDRVGSGRGEGTSAFVSPPRAINTSPDPLSCLTPFTSCLSHLLEALTVCLRELPPSYLDPDLESDCAATWFIFRNAVKHLSQALSRTQQAAVLSGTPRWDNYAYKLMSRFLDVLIMIGRQGPYIERIAQLLEGAQTECAEIEWPQLVRQALICVGFYPDEEKIGGKEQKGNKSLSERQYFHFPLKGNGAAAGRAQENTGKRIGGGILSVLSLASHGSVGKLQRLHRQFTEAYARKCQQRYISSFFLLLRQLLVHPSLRPIVEAHLTLPLALSFLFAPQHSPETLGSVLSLVSSMVFRHEDAVLVWAFIEKHQLFGPTSPAFMTEAASAPSGSPGLFPGEHDTQGAPQLRWDGPPSASGETAGPATSPLYPFSHQEKTMNLLRHCHYEKTQGKFPITIGFLNLVLSLFRHDPAPQSTRGGLYRTVANVVSQDIFCGLCHRSFVDPLERYTVMALGAAVLRQSLLIRFDAPFPLSLNSASSSLPTHSTTPTSPTSSSAQPTAWGVGTMTSSCDHDLGRISFATVMAHNLGPTDVVGEVLSAIDLVLSSDSEVLSHQRVAIRQCLQLLHTAVYVAEEGKFHLFSLDVRTTQSPSLASKLLLLCHASHDLLLAKAALELLLCFPTDIIAEAARYWHVQVDSLVKTTKFFTDLLHPCVVIPPIAEVEPALAILSSSFFSHVSVSSAFPSSAWCGRRDDSVSSVFSCAASPPNDATLQEVKALLLHLLTIHAHATEPSLTAWVCGFQSRNQASSSPSIAHSSSALSSSPTPSPFSLLVSILLGATNAEVEREHPSLAVKYVKLLYALRSSRLHGESVMRAFLETRGAPLFLRLLQWEPTSGDPILLSKYAYVMQLLTLEVLYVYQHAPKQLSMSFNTLPSIPLEVALSLLHPQRTDAAVAVHDPFLDVSSSGLPREAGRPDDNAEGWALRARSASPDIAQWMLQVLRSLPVFPSDLGIPSVSTVLSPYGDSFLVQATDQVLQYDIYAVYHAMQKEHWTPKETDASGNGGANSTVGSGKVSSWSAAEVKARLSPYVEANRCFLVYTSVENFMTSLCQFLSLSCCTVDGIPVDRLLGFAATVLSSLELTCVLTVASQEKVTYRLCHLLPTIICRLHTLAGGHTQGVTRAMRGSGGDAPHGYASVSQATLGEGGGRATGGENGLYGGQGGRGGDRCSGAGLLFSTVAGNTSNVLHTFRCNGDGRAGAMEERFGTAEAGVGTVACRTSACGEDAAYEGTLSGLNGRALGHRHTLLPPVLEALIRWGPRLPCIRLDLYHSLLLLSVLPGVRLGECLGLYRAQEALLQLLVDEICQPYHAPSLYHALTLLLQLVQSAPSVCRAFACARDDGQNGKAREEPRLGEGSTGLGPLAMRCFHALFTAVDLCTLDLTTYPNTPSSSYASTGVPGGAPVGDASSGVLPDFKSTQLLIRATFELLRALSVHHTAALLQGNLLLRCIKMDIWARSAQMVLGHAVVAAQATSRGTGSLPVRHTRVQSRNALLASSSDPHYHQLQQEQQQQMQVLQRGQEAARTLFFMTMRWMNVMLASPSGATSPVLLQQVHYFFLQRRPLVDFFLRLPISFHRLSSTSAPSSTAYSLRSGGEGGASSFPSAAALPHSSWEAGPRDGSAVSPLSHAAFPSLREEDDLVGGGWSSLSLYVELSALLRGLASSPATVNDCRRLAVELAIPQLLLTFAQGVSLASGGGTSEKDSHGAFTSPSPGTRGGGGLAHHGEADGKHAAGPLWYDGAPSSVMNAEEGRRGMDDRPWVVLYHLSDFLLRCEYGLRAEVEHTDKERQTGGGGGGGAVGPDSRGGAECHQTDPNPSSPSSSSSTTPSFSSATNALLASQQMMRHRPEDMECILFTLETLSQSCWGVQRHAATARSNATLPNAASRDGKEDLLLSPDALSSLSLPAENATETSSLVLPPLRVMECSVFTLHALVCLVQSFVLPLCDASCERCGLHFPLYLQSLHLERYTHVLKGAQEAVQQWFPLFARRVGGPTGGEGGPLFHSSLPFQEEALDGAGRGRQEGGRTAGMGYVGASPSTTVQGGDAADERTGAAPPPTPPRSCPPTPQTEGLPRSSNGREHLAGGGGPTARGGGRALPSSVEAAWPMTSTSTVLHRMADGRQVGKTVVNRKRRLGDYFPHHDATALLMGGATSMEASGADESERKGQLGEAWSTSFSIATAPSWDNVLSIEYAVRLLQIVIANALRSVSVSLELNVK